jgi:hypothetical protein
LSFAAEITDRYNETGGPVIFASGLQPHFFRVRDRHGA